MFNHIGIGAVQSDCVETETPVVVFTKIPVLAAEDCLARHYKSELLKIDSYYHLHLELEVCIGPLTLVIISL